MPAWSGTLLLVIVLGGEARAKGFDFAFLPLDVPQADLTSSEARALSDIYEEELARLSFSAPSMEAVRNALRAETRAKGGRCEDVPCVAAVGRTLKVSKVIRLRAVPYGQPNLILALRSVDVRTGENEDRPAAEYSKSGRRLSYDLFRSAVQEQLTSLISQSSPHPEPLVVNDVVLDAPPPAISDNQVPEVQKEARPPERGWKTWTAVGTGAVGVGLVALGVVSQVSAVSQANQLRDLSGRNLLASDMNRYRSVSAAYNSDVAWMATGYAVGAAALVGATYLFLTDRRPSSKPFNTVVGPNGVTGSFIWP